MNDLLDRLAIWLVLRSKICSRFDIYEGYKRELGLVFRINLLCRLFKARHSWAGTGTRR